MENIICNQLLFLCPAPGREVRVQVVDSDDMKTDSFRISGSGVIVWCDALSTCCPHCCSTDPSGAAAAMGRSRGEDS